MRKLMLWGAAIPFLLLLNGFIYRVDNYLPRKVCAIVYLSLVILFILSMSVFVVFGGRPDPFGFNKNKNDENE